VRGIKVLAAMLDGADAKALRETMDKLKDKLKTAAIVLARGRRRQGAAGRRRHRRQHRQLKAGELVNFVAQQVGGKGGGKPDSRWPAAPTPSRSARRSTRCEGWVAERV
jgi:alanyl-tRNA synthetase